MLFGCTRDADFREADLLGRWVILNPRAQSQAQATLILDAAKTVLFQSVSGRDVGLSGVSGDAHLPQIGEWRLQNQQRIVTFRFSLGGVTYDHSAKVDFKNRQLYFTVGDPDMVERIYYRKE
jgi:hypothetical protein